MQIRDLPYTDPGEPDTRSGPRFLFWLGRMQLGGQFKSLGWGLLHFLSIAALPYGVGIAVEAVVAGESGGLAVAGGVLAVFGIGAGGVGADGVGGRAPRGRPRSR
ncbi:hypothetical protein ACWEO9_14145, partial [Streptomyces albidoflavus]